MGAPKGKGERDSQYVRKRRSISPERPFARTRGRADRNESPSSYGGQRLFALVALCSSPLFPTLSSAKAPLLPHVFHPSKRSRQSALCPKLSREERVGEFLCTTDSRFGAISADSISGVRLPPPLPLSSLSARVIIVVIVVPECPSTGTASPARLNQQSRDAHVFGRGSRVFIIFERD